MPGFDLRGAGRGYLCRDQGRHAVLVPFHVNVIIVAVRRADHQVADGRLHHLAVCDQQAVDVQPVSNALLRDGCLKDGRIRRQVLDVGVINIRLRDPGIRNARRTQQCIDSSQVCRVDLPGVDGPGADLVRSDSPGVDLVRRYRSRADLLRRHGPRVDLLRCYR